MSAPGVPPQFDALLADAEVVHLRPVGVQDAAALRLLHERVSPRSVYLRFFTTSPAPGHAYVERLVRPPAPDHTAIVAELGGQIVAVGGYEQLEDPAAAEVAFLVDDAHQGLGIATLLLEHLAAHARGQGVRRFAADTLPDNARMLQVFSDAGFPITSVLAGGVVRVEFPTEQGEPLLAAADARDAAATATSIRRLLTPASVAVVGAGSDPAGLGHQVLANLVDGGFTGTLAAVNRNALAVRGVPGYRSLRDIPGQVDLVVVAVPAAGVLDVARDAATRGARGLVVISAGFAETGPAGAERQRQLVQICRRGSMRLIGPNCMGVLNTAPGVSMNATFVAAAPPTGGVGLMSQSGAVGIVALSHATRTGTGLSTFVSAGNKADVSGNDLLCYWERDPATRVCALYLESFGNPRRFARIARRVSRDKPIVVVKAGTSAAGARGARSHTAAAATPQVAVDALFGQAGVIRADGLAELFDIATMLDRAPLPAGGAVAIVGNSGGGGVLAADACEAAGLAVPELGAATRQALSVLAGPGAAVGNPVDLLADADPDTYARALHHVLADEIVDAVIAVYTPVRPGGERLAAAAIAAVVAQRPDKPVIACMLGVPEMPEELRGPGGAPLVPYHPYPETAARALAAAARYAAVRRRPPGTPAFLEGIDRDAARALVEAVLRETPQGRWLDADEATGLVSCYGVPVVPTVRVADVDAAVEAASRLGGPVALKAAAGDLVHKTDIGAVALGLAGPEEVRGAYRRMAGRLGEQMGGAVIQPMAGGGVDAAVGVVHDEAFGPLVMVGLGGVATDLLADRAYRILPLSVEDAAEQVRSLRSAPLLSGYRGSDPVNIAALEEILLRVARLAGDLPEVAELDLNPVLVTATGAHALDVKIRITPARETYPLLRHLR